MYKRTWNKKYGKSEIYTKENSACQLVEIDMVRLADGEQKKYNEENKEYGLVILGGKCSVTGDGFEFNPIAASVIGGVSLAGGYGDILGTFIGAIFMAALENGVLKLQMNTAYQYVIKGCIIIAVVIFDAWFNSVMEKRAQEAAAGGKEE